MRIGIDFDNTIVSYDALFYKVAREQDVVPADTPVNKVAVRDYLRQVGKEDVWTAMQGYVYGARMDEAIAYPGVLEFLFQAGQAGHTLAIVSHKTKHPFLGPQYDLHAAARAWVEQHLHRDGVPLVAADSVFFELTKDAKLQRATQWGCELFIDDLPEILLAPGFPTGARRVLFDPESHHHPADVPGCQVVQSWAELGQLVAL
ncbi:haloacid dehalogenase-like hydrolase [Rhodoferax saidenbachensis]|uniref:Haloacid dehalogenase-like hydrolase n=1 Tax=Rhodoferax saidenbachensis TaxID=1484693 RepID=A0A1P8K6H1_9BURK|nr:haloacid dehalogenase-like hydrolase [Rhodoferax saidenbachensis]APW41610.1 haloacid dehalogenase-like hydrolase [Rhodoferax saidenbachensis]